MSLRRIRRAPAKQWLPRQSFGLAEEIRTIQHRAAERDSRIVRIGPLIPFSTQIGDAWILDPSDQLAARLAEDGEPLPIYTEETDANYSIGWQGRFRIDAEMFIYEDNESRRRRSIMGYPLMQG